jgi:DME family drug/metabolite transporter
MPMDGKVLGLLTALFFGLNPVLLKLGFLRSGRSNVAVVIGLAVAVPIYVLVAPLFGGFEFSRVTVPALIGFALGGLLGGGVGRTWMYRAIDLLGAAPATAIKNGAPVITTLLAIVIFHEHVTWLQWLAVAIIVLGVTLVTWRRGDPGKASAPAAPGAVDAGRADAGTAPSTTAPASRFTLAALRSSPAIKTTWTTGVVVALGSALVYGIRPLFLKFGLEQADIPLTGTLIGAVAALVYAALVAGARNLAVGLREPSLGLFAASGVLQAFGFLALTFALASGDVSVVYPVVSTAPLITLGFTAVLLRGKEELTARIAVGVVAVVAGVAVL